jgi:hypothetical protein
MTASVNYLLDRSSAALLIFIAAAALSCVLRLSPSKRIGIGIGLAAIVAATLIPISTRSGFEWIVSAIERPSAPGLLLLAVYAFSAITGRTFGRSAEYRFGTAMLVIAGILLYPGAVGFLNYDPYVLGYSGYLLPAALVILLAYALYRRFYFIVAALDIGILGFLLGAGRSLNLWDYVIDPGAWALAAGAWIAIFGGWLIRKLRSGVTAPAVA